MTDCFSIAFTDIVKMNCYYMICHNNDMHGYLIGVFTSIHIDIINVIE